MIMRFFAHECPRFFGPILRDRLADVLLGLFERFAPATSRLKHGQMLWTALDKRTRGDSPHRRLVPVVLTVVCEQDVHDLTEGKPMSTITGRAMARMIREAYEQGGILSSRDLGLITLRSPSRASSIRRQYEHEHGCTLPHTGALHDMGSCVSHKSVIIRKVIVENKDPAQVARECHHTQAAVDAYLKDYHRVKTLFDVGHDVDMIHFATQLAKHVIAQYIDIIHEQQTDT